MTDLTTLLDELERRKTELKKARVTGKKQVVPILRQAVRDANRALADFGRGQFELTKDETLARAKREAAIASLREDPTSVDALRAVSQLVHGHSMSIPYAGGGRTLLFCSKCSAKICVWDHGAVMGSAHERPCPSDAP